MPELDLQPVRRALRLLRLRFAQVEDHPRQAPKSAGDVRRFLPAKLRQKIMECLLGRGGSPIDVALTKSKDLFHRF